MNNKNIVIVFSSLFIVGLVLFSMFWFEVDKNTNGEVCIQVVTSARNPKTGEIKDFGTPCDVPAGWEVLEGDGLGVYMNGNNKMKRFRSADLGISFDYLLSPDGYEFIEENIEQTPGKALEKAYILISTKENQELNNPAVSQEVPPAIYFMIFKNTENLNSLEWIKKHQQVANYNPTIFTNEVSVGGANGVRYSSFDLYQNDILVIENNGRIYIIIGTYDSSEDKIRKDFLSLINTVIFF